ncbi:MAG: zinc ribbon domain-containing protein [Acidobacteriota bacterium]|nr:zinc ribbon domain-containing protein [Acidobacteriota bacterium]
MTEAARSSFRPWHLFALVALLAATVAIVVARPSDPVGAVLLTLAIGAAGFVGLMVFRVLTPLTHKEFRETTVMAGSRSRAAVEREKTLVLRSIKELEFDRAMGKVSDVDFQGMGHRLRARALRLMKQLDVEAVDFLAVIERELQTRLDEADLRPAAPADQQTCVGCGTSNDVDARFCKSCGTTLGESS